MSKFRVLWLVGILVLLALSQSGTAQTAQSAPWVSKTVATQFVDNLLQTYNSAGIQYHLAHPDQALSGHFVLYFPQLGGTFNVTVMRLLANESSYVCFVFTPVVGGNPQVVVDNNVAFIPGYVSPSVSSTFNDFRPNNTLGTEIRQGVFVGPNASGYSPLVWVGYTSRLTSDPSGYAAAVAQYVFNEDVSSIPPLPWYSPVTGFLNSLNDSPPMRAVDSVFGSPIVPVVIVVAFVVIVTRERVKREIREALHMKQPIPKKKKHK